MLGTHNSMTYLQPQKWVMRAFRFVARCQEINLKSQYNMGARIFDMRVYFDSKNRPMFKHGKMKYSGNVYDMFDFLNSKSDCYVRLILEQDKKDDDKTKAFCQFCKDIIARCPNIIFFGGNRKFDWAKVYKFDHEDLNCVQIVSSMDGKKINDLCPRQYAKRHNKELIAKHDPTKEHVLVDFINIDIVK